MLIPPFQKKCQKVADTTGVDVYFPGGLDRGMKDDQFEDDGSLHIRKSGTWACFDVGRGQSAPGAEQNKRTRAVMEALGMAKKIGDRVLVDEDKEEDERCPHCGR